jgi:SHS2 domain-containing protein
MNKSPVPAGYREIEHTADWQLFVWAPTLPALFCEAARGMYALSGLQVDQPLNTKRTLQLEEGDVESLLVRFLSELLYFAEQSRLAFPEIELKLDETRLFAELKGAQILSQAKEIKAVTYHKLAIKQVNQQVQVSIVFDV